MPRKGKASPPLGIVRDWEVLTVGALAKRLGKTERCIYETMILAGLPVKKVARLSLVSGKSFRKFIESLPCPPVDASA